MVVWLIPFLMLLACFILGRLVAALFIEPRQDKLDWLSTGFSSAAVGVGLLGWIALVLAEVGFYSIGAMGLIWLMLVILLAVLVFRKRRSAEPEKLLAQDDGRDPFETAGWRLTNWVQPLFLGVWFLAASWLFFRPHQYILGAADAGVYVNLAASIDDKGSIVYKDETLARMDPSLKEGVLRPLPEDPLYNQVASSYLLPGFYVTDADSGQIVPQFFHLHPIWQAIAYGAGGVDAALLMTGLWALLGSLAVYLTAKELAGWPAAAIALIGITLNALQIWFARYPSTEALTQFLLWTSVWASLVWIRTINQFGTNSSHLRARAFWGLLAGMMLGQLFLTRIDTYFLLVIPVGLWIWLRRTKSWSSYEWIYFVTVGLLTLHSLAHAYWLSRPYAANLFGYGLLLVENYWPFVLAGLVLILIIMVIASYLGRSLVLPDRWLRYLKIALAAVVVVFTLYAWFIRPQTGGPDVLADYWYGGGQIPLNLDRENLVRIGWYLSPVTIILATAGTCLMILRLNLRIGLVLAAGLSFAFLYIWRIQINPHQVYAMRRYVPAVMPFAVISSSYLLGWVILTRERWLRTVGALLTFLWVISLAWSARGFISQVDYAGMEDQLAEINKLISPHSILLFNDQSAVTVGDIIGTPLSLLFDHDVFSIRDPVVIDQDQMKRTLNAWRRTGREIYWIGDTALAESLGIASIPVQEAVIVTNYLEGSYEKKPTAILEARWSLNINQVVP